MEKTNKCSAQFICWGSESTCCYRDEKLEQSGEVFVGICRFYMNGHCTNKQAILDCLSKEGLINEF